MSTTGSIMVSSVALLPSPLNAVSVAPRHGHDDQQAPCTHELLAQALAMRSSGQSVQPVISTLVGQGLTVREARKVVSAIDCQLGHSRALTRRVQVLVVASIAVQVLLALVMASLSISAAPIPAFVALAIVARVCRADRPMLQQLSRQQHLFG